MHLAVSRHRNKRGIGRVVECTGLENRRTLIAFPGFESLVPRREFNKIKGLGANLSPFFMIFSMKIDQRSLANCSSDTSPVKGQLQSCVMLRLVAFISAPSAKSCNSIVAEGVSCFAYLSDY